MVRIFGLYSGQRMNEGKTAVMVHGAEMQQEVRNFYMDKLKQKINIIGIVYSFSEDCVKENVLKTMKKMEKVVEVNKTRNLTMYGKIQIIKTKLIPLIFPKMQCLMMANHVTEINNMLWNFFWYPQKHRTLTNDQLVVDYTFGGLNMVDIISRYKASTVYKLKEIAKSNDKKEFWIKYAYYNIGSVLKCVNSKLYNNLEPHAFAADVYWNEVRSILLEYGDELNQMVWESIKLKELYVIIKGKSLGSIIADGKPWKNIQLLNKSIKRHFTNFEREISFLIAHDAYWFGQKRRYLLPFIDVENWMNDNCKFCNCTMDNTYHLFKSECVVIKQVLLSCKHFFWFLTGESIDIKEDMIIYNEIHSRDFQKNFKNSNIPLGLLKLKMISILKRVLIERKLKLDKFNKFVTLEKRQDFINLVLCDIRLSLGFFIKNYLK